MTEIDIEKIIGMDQSEIIENFKMYERTIMQKDSEIEKLTKTNQNFLSECHTKDKYIYELRKQVKELKIQRLGELNASIIFQKVSDSQLTHRHKGLLSNSICNILEAQKKEIINSFNYNSLEGSDDLPF